MKRQRNSSRLALNRETLINLEPGVLHTAIGAATDTVSAPCCPPTAVGCDPTAVTCPTVLCTKIKKC